MSRYDFSETADFLNNDRSLADIYEDIMDSMGKLQSPRPYLRRDDKREVWHTLLTCADLLDTIRVRPRR